MCPQSASTLSAMGYNYALTGCYSNAVDCFHKVWCTKNTVSFQFWVIYLLCLVMILAKKFTSHLLMLTYYPEVSRVRFFRILVAFLVSYEYGMFHLCPVCAVLLCWVCLSTVYYEWMNEWMNVCINLWWWQALGLRRDDTFSTTMLNNAIEQLVNEMEPCSGD